MKTLSSHQDNREILNRMASLMPSDSARWGRMNVSQAVCHMGDAMLVPLGEKSVSETGRFDPLRLTKWPALWGPMNWPKGFPTRPELDQCRLGMPAGNFESSRQRTMALLLRLAETDVGGRRHSMFGRLTRVEWMRWGWLHADHHLRQFGR
jgi:Protein of unknown function (DUF1569)